jgi:hypothetical protein
LFFAIRTTPHPARWACNLLVAAPPRRVYPWPITPLTPQRSSSVHPRPISPFLRPRHAFTLCAIPKRPASPNRASSPSLVPPSEMPFHDSGRPVCRPCGSSAFIGGRRPSPPSSTSFPLHAPAAVPPSSPPCDASTATPKPMSARCPRKPEVAHIIIGARNPATSKGETILGEDAGTRRVKQVLPVAVALPTSLPIRRITRARLSSA